MQRHPTKLHRAAPKRGSIFWLRFFPRRSAATIAYDFDDPVESFRQGWDDAMQGRTVSREEFRKRMREDAD